MKKIAVVGLGYVGLGLAVSFAKKFYTYGYDISKSRIAELSDCQDKNGMISTQELQQSNLKLTHDIETIRQANFYIISVSTPAYYYELPNLESLILATRAIGKILKKGDTVVFESTVYPGATEEVCIPLLEKESKLQSCNDFDVGYSPERVNPGDKQHGLHNIPKIIGAESADALHNICDVYRNACPVICPVSSIKVAEAIKILENTQRDINIAFMNEFSQIMHALSIDTHEVLEGAKTKWSFIPMRPGFVGGHCIAIDPTYLAFQAKRHGVEPKIISLARQINDSMPSFIIHEMNKMIIKNNLNFEKIKIGVFGLTYKENVPDMRNSLAFKLIKELREFGYHVVAHDPWVDKKSVFEKYKIPVEEFKEMQDLSIGILLVQHDFYLQQGFEKILAKLCKNGILMDIPNAFFDKKHIAGKIRYWSL